MDVQSSHAFAHWNQLVHQVCGAFTTIPSAHATQFIGDIRHRNLGGLHVAHISSNAGLIKRLRGKTDRGDDEFYFLVMQQAGSMHIESDERQWVLHPGEMALLDSSDGFAMRPQTLFHQISLHLPRVMVDDLLRSRRISSNPVLQDSLNGKLLRLMVEQIARPDGGNASPAQDGMALQRALIALLQPVFPEHDLRHGAAIRKMAEQLIERSLQAPPSPAQLASQLHVSVRQLYRYFELNDESISRYILRRRLEHSARDLVTPSAAPLSITSIAFRWGFNDSAHFSRAFKRHFGVAPKEYRLAEQKPGARTA